MRKALEPVLRGAGELAVAQGVLLLVLLMAEIGQRIEAQLQQQSEGSSTHKLTRGQPPPAWTGHFNTYPMRG